jgi:putative DeoR family transcriptional regulator (stage III sporulation protein D)
LLDISKRVIKEAEHIIETKETIRETAKKFKISKSTVHKDLQERLIKIDKSLSEDVKKILKEHIDTRHIRGGESTKKKYLKLIK